MPEIGRAAAGRDDPVYHDPIIRSPRAFAQFLAGFWPAPRGAAARGEKNIFAL